MGTSGSVLPLLLELLLDELLLLELELELELELLELLLPPLAGGVPLLPPQAVKAKDNVKHALSSVGFDGIRVIDILPPRTERIRFTKGKTQMPVGVCSAPINARASAASDLSDNAILILTHCASKLPEHYHNCGKRMG